MVDDSAARRNEMVSYFRTKVDKIKEWAPYCAMIPRSRRHPVADLRCTNRARYTFESAPLCGVHLRQQLARRYDE